jgi:hypothetical protein
MQDTIYEVVPNYWNGFPAVVIHRPPSEIPSSLDRDLFHLTSHSDMHGKEMYVAYICRFDKTLSVAEKLLQEYGWRK